MSGDLERRVWLPPLAAAVVYLLSALLESDYLCEFLDQNLLILVAALLAINATTAGVIVTRIREIKNQYGVGFQKGASSLKRSLRDQVGLFIAAVLVLVAKHSDVLGAWKYTVHVADFLLLSALAYAVYITFDSAKAVFVIVEGERDLKAQLGPSSTTDLQQGKD